MVFLLQIDLVNIEPPRSIQAFAKKRIFNVSRVGDTKCKEWCYLTVTTYLSTLFRGLSLKF